MLTMIITYGVGYLGVGSQAWGLLVVSMFLDYWAVDKVTRIWKTPRVFTVDGEEDVYWGK